MLLNIEFGFESQEQNTSRTEQIQNTQIIDVSPVQIPNILGYDSSASAIVQGSFV